MTCAICFEAPDHPYHTDYEHPDHHYFIELQPQDLWIPMEIYGTWGDCATCEATDGPGTGNPWPCSLHPKSKPSKR